MARITLPHNPELKGLLDLRANIPFAAPDGQELALQLIKPQWSSGGQGFPLVLFIQGSAWTKPNQFWQLPQLAQLAAQGYVIASVTHRACWTAPAPAFLLDVKTALRFLRAHAREYDIDKERVCAWGTSSGGNTALLLGVTGDDPAFEGEEWAGESTRVQAVVDCFGPSDLARIYDAHPERIQPADDNLFYALGGRDLSAIRENFARISPVNYVKPGLELPPFMLLHGDADELVAMDQSEVMYDLLLDNGYQADLVHVTNAPHEGTFWSPELLDVVFAFIRRHLG